MRLPEIIDQHEDAARFLRLRVEGCPSIKGNCDMAIYGTFNSEDLLVCPMANSCISEPSGQPGPGEQTDHPRAQRQLTTATSALESPA